MKINLTTKSFSNFGIEIILIFVFILSFLAIDLAVHESTNGDKNSNVHSLALFFGKTQGFDW
jgi:hypothetical protein